MKNADGSPISYLDLKMKIQNLCPLVTKNAIFLFSHRGIIFTMMPLNLKKFYIGAKIFETNPPHIEK